MVFEFFQSAQFMDFLSTIKPLSLFVFGMTIYGIFVYKFYLFLSRKDILKMEGIETSPGFKGAMKFLAKISSHTVQNLILIPLLVFFWFAVLAGLLVLLSKNHTPDTIMLISISIVAAVRITAYYNEDLSREIAKMIPFALLGVFLVDISYFSVEKSISTLTQFPNYWRQLIYYLIFVVFLEFIMRGFQFIGKLLNKKDEKKEN